MAGVFKSLDKADIRITPFRSYKGWEESPINGNYYTIYEANYNPQSDYLQYDPLKDTFNQGVPTSEPTTSNGQYQRVVHRSIDHLFYKNFYTNNKASFGSGNINTQFRYLEDQATVVSLPQSRFGEMILPESIMMTMTGSFGVLSGSYFTQSVITAVTNSWTVIDDGFGNMVISGSSYYSPYGQYVGGAYTNYSSSVSKTVVGQWPHDECYQYLNIGPYDLTSSFNRGDWQMDSYYKNVSAINITSSTNPYPADAELLGSVLHFTASLSSSIRVTPKDLTDNRIKYNFENGDFSISMIVKPTQKPTHTSGSILINKQGPVEEIRMDANGNVYTQQATTKTPYRLIYTSGSNKLKFEKEGGSSAIFSMTSSLSMSIDTIYHIAAVKSGSAMTLYVNSASGSSVDTATVTVADSNTVNLSDIYIGNNYKLDQGFNGIIDNVKIYNNNLSQNDMRILHHTVGVGSTIIGNAFYNQGMVVLTSIPSRYSDIVSIRSRGTLTLYETEISCTISPGEFGMSTNPTLHEYDAETGEHKFRSFVTGSTFKPYITTIGLYDDFGNLLAIGKVNTPIQTPNNVDTTFIIKYDR